MAKTVRRLFAADGWGEAKSDILDGTEGPAVVHIEGVGLVGTTTLCGHVDRTDMIWQDTPDEPTCCGCLAVWKFVKNGKF